MMKTLRSIIALVALVLTVGACGAATGAEGPVVGDEATTTLVVENQSTSDMRIYAIASGQQVRLGSVTGLRTERLRLSQSLVGNGRELSFIADPLAGQSVASSFQIYVAPGEEVRLVIPPTVR